MLRAVAACGRRRSGTPVHQVSGRWKLGFALALATSALWGTLPIALKVAVERVDPQTVTWLRFSVSAAVLGLVLASRRTLPALGPLTRIDWTLLAISLAGLVGNYLTFLHALRYLSPTVNQVLIQLAPMFLLFGGVALFHERLHTAQRLGIAALVIGLLLFFNQRLAHLDTQSAGFALGVGLLVIAALSWAVYGLAQKLLLRTLGSQQILLIMYAGAAVMLAPLAHPSELAQVSPRHIVALLYSSANTVLSYGAFVAALEHWEVSRVSAVLATAPIFTVIAASLSERLWPGMVPLEPLNALSLAGALVVVAGSISSALGSRGRRG
jgi:drug/metabolite transporter (DMT)-like permease